MQQDQRAAQHERVPGDSTDSNSQKPPPGITHSIRPGVPPPDTVLVAVMSDGSYVLMAHPYRETVAFIARDDADVLRNALHEAFGNPTAEDMTRRHCP